MQLVNSAVVDNLVSVDEGEGVPRGGGIFLGEAAAALLINSTVSGNEAAGANDSLGGGVYVGPTSAIALINATVVNNVADLGGGVYLDGGFVFLTDTLVSNNSGVIGVDEFQNDGGEVDNNGFNLFGRSGTAGVSGFTPDATDIVPIESPAQIFDQNLGVGSTHALVAGSPAIDASPTPCINPTDQRGALRPQGPGCDIGAFEAAAAPVTPPPPPPVITPPPPPPVIQPPTLPPVTVTPVIPPSGIACTGTRCRVPVQCNGAPGQVCQVSVRILVKRSALNLREARQSVFAAGVTNVPAGQVGTIRPKLRKAGRNLVRNSVKRTIRGTASFTNTVGTTISVTNVPTRIRLPRR